jgi:quinol monooxygenase YgiN
MSASVVVSFVCTVLAAVSTGVLVGRCVRAPRADLVAWSCAAAALAVALGAQAAGSQSGYGSATFRIVQIGAQLVAPLCLAWGIVELTGRGSAVRFGAKLITAGLTFVAAVVLVTDPLSATPFSKSWPAASAHYQIIPKSLLNLVAGVTVLTVVIALAVAGARARHDPAWRRPMLAVAAAGAAALVVLGLRLTLPNSGYALLCAASAGLVWFAGTRADQVDLEELHEEVMPAAERRPRGLRAGAGEAGDPRDEIDRPDERYWPYRGTEMDGLYSEGFGYDPEERFDSERNWRRDNGDPGRMGIWRPRGLGRNAPMAEDAADSEADEEAAPAAPGGADDPQGGQRTYGLIAIYTLAGGQADEFDALAEQVVDEVRASEPDTLVYAAHTVPNAPMQRIFYEVYRDKGAYQEHLRQPHVQRFDAERAPYVVATNVVELGVQQAKLLGRARSR